MTDPVAIGWIDLAMLAVIALSALVGAVRGLTFEVLSLLGWVAAWFAASGSGRCSRPHLPVGAPGSPLNGIAAFASAFLVVLVLWGLGARAVVGPRRQDAAAAARPASSVRSSVWRAAGSSCSRWRRSSRTRRPSASPRGASRTAPPG
jgi:hypothetical protein